MKQKFLLLLCLALPLCCFAVERNFLTNSYYNYNNYNSDIESVFLYGKLNSMGGYPMTGAGIRIKKGFSGLDISGSVVPINGLSPVIYTAKANYLFFPIQEGFYLGLGAGALTEPESIKGISAFAEGNVGYQWRIKGKSHIFIEGSAIAPYKANKSVTGAIWPSVAFGFGF